MARHSVRAEGTFGSAFGGSVGCILGIAAALLGIGVLGVLMCAGVIGGCGMFAKKVVDDVQKHESEREAEEKERARKEPRSTAPAQYSSVGYARAQVKSAKIGKVELLGDKASKDDYLIITVELSMTDDAKRWEYYGWKDDSDKLLSDSQGNKYKQPSFGFGSMIKGVTHSAKIVAGKPVTTILVFDVPPPGVTELNLDLPANGVEGNGFFRFKIPASMWK